MSKRASVQDQSGYCAGTGELSGSAAHRIGYGSIRFLRLQDHSMSKVKALQIYDRSSVLSAEYQQREHLRNIRGLDRLAKGVSRILLRKSYILFINKLFFINSMPGTLHAKR